MSSNDEINTLQTGINDLDKNYDYKYVELSSDTIFPINTSFKPIISDEDGLNSGYLTTEQYWTGEYTNLTCSKNSKIVYSDILSKEEQKIDSSDILKLQGLVVNKISTNGILANNGDRYVLVNSFPNIDIPTNDKYSNNLNVSLEQNTAVEFFGYFRPNSTGIWKFKLYESVSSRRLWLDDVAIYEYKAENANINGHVAELNKEYSQTLVKNKLYFIRIQLGNFSQNIINGPFLEITTPTDEKVYGNTPNYNYFIYSLYHNIHINFKC
jgi:hypothetical protein